MEYKKPKLGIVEPITWDCQIWNAKKKSELGFAEYLRLLKFGPKYQQRTIVTANKERLKLCSVNFKK